MNRAELVAAARKHIETLFPKRCSGCHRVFPDLADYLRNTTYLAEPISYDAELGMWTPARPIGGMSMANCNCGTTLALASTGMNPLMMLRMLRWARRESQRRKISVRVLLAEVRAEIDAAVLAEAGEHAGDVG